MLESKAISELGRLRLTDSKYKMINKKISGNKRKDPVLHLYYYKVWKYTEENAIDVEGIENRGAEYHLDHIIPISFGFKNGINPKIIGSNENIRIISRDENLIKFTILTSDSYKLLDKLSLIKIPIVKTEWKRQEDVFKTKPKRILSKCEKDYKYVSLSDREKIILNNFVHSFGEFSL